MKKATLSLVFALVLFGCGSVPTQKTIPTATVQNTIAPSPTSTPSPTPTATPVPDIGGLNYVGYWIKIVKTPNEYGSWTMRLFYQDEYYLREIANFCVRGGDNNTPDGFYYIVIDRPTTYPTARGEYATTYFSHNFGFKLAWRNWYLHSAPWNDQGFQGCPVKSSGGCVNMRPTDFDVILNGGNYTNPLTGETANIPDLKVGTPFVVVQEESTCTYLGQCMNAYACQKGVDCFRQFSCASCKNDWLSRWQKLVFEAPFLEVLDER